MIAGEPDDGAFRSRHEVRFADVDVFGHVNHLQLLGYLETARTPFFAALADAEGQPNVLRTGGFVVASLSAEYLASVALGTDVVEVHTRVSRLGTTSVALAYELWAGPDKALTASTTIVFVDTSHRPQPMTPPRREFLAQFEPTPAAALTPNDHQLDKEAQS